MLKQEISAMVSLFDDPDEEVVSVIHNHIKVLGEEVIEPLEKEWLKEDLSPEIKKKLEYLIHELQFEKLIKNLQEWRDKDSNDLLKGLWLIATFQFPDLKLANLTEMLKEMKYSVWQKCQDEIHPFDLVKILNFVVFDEFKFLPNVKNFHSPSNSFFNSVLEQKKGNPVALACLYILLAKELDIPIYGVNLPNLFVLVFEKDNFIFYINPFNNGQVFYKRDIDNYLSQNQIVPEDRYYLQCNNEDIIKRILTNLAFSFNKIGENHKQAEVVELLKIFTSV